MNLIDELDDIIYLLENKRDVAAVSVLRALREYHIALGQRQLK